MGGGVGRGLGWGGIFLSPFNLSLFKLSFISHLFFFSFFFPSSFNTFSIFTITNGVAKWVKSFLLK